MTGTKPPKRTLDARELPVLEQEEGERADAAVNRRKILKAAEDILARHGVEGLAMADVAAAAGVGVGTLYRRFVNRTGLANALLGEREREFQAAFMFGPPPLGPGAAPGPRAEAFVHAYVDYLEAHTQLHLVAEAKPGARYRAGAYGAHHAHLASLLRKACPGEDADYLADALLAPLAVALFVHHRSERGMEVGRIKAGLTALVRRVSVDNAPE